MPRLILLNGAPASGKSTLARRFSADHPLCLVLDIDDLRAMLGDWADDPDGAGLAARRLAVAMARTHLVDGHDVVVPQLLARTAFIEELRDLAVEVGAEWAEFVLTAPLRVLQERLDRRVAEPTRRADLDAAILLERAGGEQGLQDYRDRIDALARSRPGVRVLDTGAGPEATYHALVRQVGTRRR